MFQNLKVIEIKFCKNQNVPHCSQCLSTFLGSSTSAVHRVRKLDVSQHLFYYLGFSFQFVLVLYDSWLCSIVDESFGFESGKNTVHRTLLGVPNVRGAQFFFIVKTCFIFNNG